MVRLIKRYGLDAMKVLQAELAIDCGPARKPLAPLTPADLADLREELDRMGAREWGGPAGKGA